MDTEPQPSDGDPDSGPSGPGTAEVQCGEFSFVDGIAWRDLRSADADDREDAIAKLVDHLPECPRHADDVAVLHQLRSMLEDSSSLVRRWAMDGLDYLDDLESAEKIAEIAEDRALDEYERSDALEALHSIDPVRSVSVIRALTGAALPRYLAWVVETLLAITDESRSFPDLRGAAVLSQELFYRVVDLLSRFAATGDIRLRAVAANLRGILADAESLSIGQADSVEEVLLDLDRRATNAAS